jgi:hypothetical protein
MVRLGPGDPLYSNEHHWLFITLWWDGRDNRHISELPWKYYQMTVTQQTRDESDGITHDRRNYLFNPYLEGPKSNGAVANCMTCHQFARVMPDQKSGSLLGLGAGECLGESTPGKIGNCGLKANEYEEKCGVDSDFVWSLANLNRGNSPLPPPCDATPSYFFTTH